MQEFYHRKDLSKSPFNLDLSDAELWDHVRSGKLQPFTKLKPEISYHMTDSLSGDASYDPLFPGQFKEKYERLQNLRQQIKYDQEFIKKSEDQAWQEFVKQKRNGHFDTAAKQDFLEYQKKLKKETRQGLKKKRTAAAELEKEFQDIPGLYRKFGDDLESDTERARFVTKLNDAYYWRGQIEDVLSGAATGPQEAPGVIADRNKGPSDEKWIPQWKGIAEEIGRSVSTAKKWHYEYGMPVHHDPVRALRSEINAWMEREAKKKRKSRKQSV